MSPSHSLDGRAMPTFITNQSRYLRQKIAGEGLRERSPLYTVGGNYKEEVV